MAFTWINRSLDYNFVNPDDVMGRQTKITVAAGESEIVPIPAGWMPTVFIHPVTGGAATVLQTGCLESELATTTAWIDSGYGSMTTGTAFAAHANITGLKLSATTENAVFYINV